jgi:gluconolactonase
VQANLDRWKGQFEPPAGKTAAEASKVEKMKIGEVPVTYLDVQGAYKAPTFAPNAPPAEKKADYRMIAVVFESKPNGPYFIRLVGPAKTVDANKAKFDEWLKNFK